MAPLTKRDREVILSSELTAERLRRALDELGCEVPERLLQRDGYERRIFEAGRLYGQLEAEQLRAECAVVKARFARRLAPAGAP